MNTIQDLERLVAAIEKQGANVAPTYQEYMPLAFAIANDCGEADGRCSIASAVSRKSMCPTRWTDSSTTPSKGVTGETESGLSITGQRPPA